MEEKPLKRVLVFLEGFVVFGFCFFVVGFAFGFLFCVVGGLTSNQH